MTIRPILFSASMVRALLDGRKTQTRRVLKPRPIFRGDAPTKLIWQVTKVRGIFNFDDEQFRSHAPIFFSVKKADLLWVREAHQIVPRSAYARSAGVEQTLRPDDDHDAAIYRCGWERSIPRWRSPIHMPRWASRLTLEVTDVKVERLMDITEEDAHAEGSRPWTGALQSYRTDYRLIWEEINGTGSWDINPWVAAITFRVHRGNVDAVAAQIGRAE